MAKNLKNNLQNTPLSDEKLVMQAKSGDYTSFSELLSRYEGRIFSLAMRMTKKKEDAEEVTQSTFLSLMEHLDSFRGEAKFSTWLITIATNHSLTLIRKQKKTAHSSYHDTIDDEQNYDSLPHPEFIAPWKESPEMITINRETKDLIHKAISTLELKQRSVFMLRDVEGFSTEETAQTLKISESNVKVRLLRARLELREMLTKSLGDSTKILHKAHKHEMP